MCPSQQNRTATRLGPNPVHFDNGLSELRRLLVDRILHAITASLTRNLSCWKDEKTKAQGWGTLVHNHPCVCTRHMKAAHLYFFYMNIWGEESGEDEVFVRVFCGPRQQGIRERWCRRHTDRPPPLLRFDVYHHLFSTARSRARLAAQSHLYMSD